MLYLKDNVNTNNNKIDILPMIDVIFAILAFLIISSLYLTRVDTISVDLPKATNSYKQNKNFINVSIDQQGNLFLNQSIIKLQELRQEVVNLIKKNKKYVVLNADKNISHGSVINVLDILRSIDGLKIAISTKFKN